MNYTIDASVFISSARTEETHHVVSVEFLNQLRRRQPVVFCPSIILAECSAAIARRTGDLVLAQDMVLLVKNFVGMNLVPISIPLAERAAQVAANQRLRGADSVYVAITDESGATLITWDHEMLKRAPAIVTTITPDEWLNALPINPHQPS
ncbi:MAG: PIN domain-containing protein [Acidobacteriota bacterium]|nr:PIN domain-containing protein [Acidobacteriota bacterium]